MADEHALNRSQLPIPEPPYRGAPVYDARDPGNKVPPIQQIRPPTGAPNVLVILIDDVGFGASSAFGGPINMLTAEKLAANGLIFSADETTDIGSDTGTGVSKDFTSHASKFTGKVNWVQIDLNTDDHDHLISPEERLRVAMSRQ